MGSPVGLKLDAEYGSGGSGYCAQQCAVYTANTVVKCRSVPGSGSLHRWRVGAFAHGWQSGISLAGVTTSYIPPSLTSITLDDGVSTVISTYGGETVVLTGANFGPHTKVNSVLQGCKYSNTAEECSHPYCAI